MIKNNLIWVLLFSFISCNNVNNTQKNNNSIDSIVPDNNLAKDTLIIKNDTSNYDGVLLLYSDSLQINNVNATLFNTDNSVFATILSKNGNEPSNDKLKGKILAYYPDYYIIHFDAKKLQGNAYSVKIGSTSKIIKADKYVQYLSWPDYVLKFFLTTSLSNPLRNNPFDTASEIKGLNYKQLSFKCVKITGDWVKVICNTECEGCPEGETNITGWIRWRKDGKLQIKQYYVC